MAKFANLIDELGFINATLLEKTLNSADWYKEHPGAIHDLTEYKNFLVKEGYLIDQVILKFLLIVLTVNYLSKLVLSWLYQLIMLVITP